jgi:flagellar hook-associated protein 2
MTTTSAVSSTPATSAPTPAKTTSSTVVSSASNSILTSLGTGSGVDTTSLVTSLVEAEFAPKTAALQTKYDTAATRISSVATLKSTITTFTSALKSLVTGGTLQTQPVSSSAAIGVSAVAGTVISNLSSTIAVSQLADRQSAVSATGFASSSTAVGTGTLVLTLGSATFDADGSMASFTGGGGDADGNGIDDKAVSIAVTDGSLAGIASAINAKKTGVTASVITDADGTAFLSLKGATGAAQAFTLSSATDAGSGDLSKLDVGIGATNTRFTGTAQDAKLTVDGVPVTRSSNTIGDLVTGVKLQLNQVTAAPVSLTATRSPDALSNALADLVDTYNAVLETITKETNPVDGALRSDSAAKAMLAGLKQMSSTALIPGAGGSPTTLAQMGVKTNTDGTLAVDSTAVTATLAKYPDAVEAMFTAAKDGKSGLLGLLTSISTKASDTQYGLGASATRYTAAQSDITKQQATMAAKRQVETTRLTQTYAAMNTKVAAYKSIQAYLKQQVDAWTKSDS